MTISFKYAGVTFEVSTHQEAIDTLNALRQNDARIAEAIWTPDLFQTFIGRLGESQLTALSTLTRLRRATDAALRKALGVPTNQALAGVLSGISQQATALNIPARAVFTLENIRNAGKRRSTYEITPAFLQAATLAGWPPTSRK